MKRYGDAIFEINPEANWDLSNNDLSTIKWLHGTTPIDTATIEAKAAEIETRDAHIAPRKKAYRKELGGWDKQLEMIFDDFDGWKAAVQAIKDKHPKN